MALVAKNLPPSARDTRDAGSFPGSGRSPGVGNGTPFWCSCLKNSMGRRTWWATVCATAKSQPWLSDWECMINCFSRVWLFATDPMDCSPPGSSVHGILQAGILEWVVMPSTRGPSWPRNWTHISYLLHLLMGSLPTSASEPIPLNFFFTEVKFTCVRLTILKCINQWYSVNSLCCSKIFLSLQKETLYLLKCCFPFTFPALAYT